MADIVTVRVAAPPVSVSLYDRATRLEDARLAVRTTTTATPGQDASWDVRLDVENRSLDTIEAGLVVAIDIGTSDDPDWLIPGLFYGENRPAASRGDFPRWVADAAASDDPFTASSWTFRSDRAAVPVVFGRGAGSDVAVSTAPSSPLGMTGLGFGPGELRVAFPYREEPVVYDGGPVARPEIGRASCRERL